MYLVRHGEERDTEFLGSVPQTLGEQDIIGITLRISQCLHWASPRKTDPHQTHPGLLTAAHSSGVGETGLGVAPLATEQEGAWQEGPAGVK